MNSPPKQPPRSSIAIPPHPLRGLRRAARRERHRFTSRPAAPGNAPPAQPANAFANHLLIAIGFKGGFAISEAGLAQVWLPALAAMLLGAVIPLWTYPLLRFGGRLPSVDAAAIAAHYGSVSAVTFTRSSAFRKQLNRPAS